MPKPCQICTRLTGYGMSACKRCLKVNKKCCNKCGKYVIDPTSTVSFCNSCLTSYDKKCISCKKKFPIIENKCLECYYIR